MTSDAYGHKNESESLPGSYKGLDRVATILSLWLGGAKNHERRWGWFEVDHSAASRVPAWLIFLTHPPWPFGIPNREGRITVRAKTRMF